MIIRVSGKEVRLPDFLLVGAAKSGTTSLYNYLRNHPQIFMPRVKEPYFFYYYGKKSPSELPSRPKPMPGIIWDIEEYFKLFEDAGDKYKRGEASALYLYDYKTTITNIKRIYGTLHKKIKIIIILRNPVERTWSQYMMHKRDGIEPLSLKEAISVDIIEKRLNDRWLFGFDYIGFGNYYKQVSAYMEEFPEIKVLLFEDLTKKGAALMGEIYEFLGVDRNFISDIDIRYNVSGIPKSKIHSFIYNLLQNYNPLKSIVRNIIKKNTKEKIRNIAIRSLMNRPQMDCQTREYLSDKFRNDIIKLQSLIGQDLSHWLKNHSNS